MLLCMFIMVNNRIRMIILKAGNITKAIQKAQRIVEDEHDYGNKNPVSYWNDSRSHLYPAPATHSRQHRRTFHSRKRITETYTLLLSKFPATQREIGLPCARHDCKRLVERDTYCISKRTAKNSVRDYFHIDCAVMLHIWPIDEENEPLS